MRKGKIRLYAAVLSLLLVVSCNDESVVSTELIVDNTNRLGYYGEFEEELVQDSNGVMQIDTNYYPIPKFSFINQSGKTITQRDASGRIVVSDFFFTTCKSICPMLSSQMSRLQVLVEKAGLSNEVVFLSHSVDPLHDRPDTLKAYAEHLGANFDNWHFLTIDTASFTPKYVYELAQEGYYLTAFPSDTAQGGFFHTDKITLLDRTMRIRGYYDGTSTAGVDKLLSDLKILVNEPAAKSSK